MMALHVEWARTYLVERWKSRLVGRPSCGLPGSGGSALLQQLTHSCCGCDIELHHPTATLCTIDTGESGHFSDNAGCETN
jgi:hypothetical protein